MKYSFIIIVFLISFAIKGTSGEIGKSRIKQVGSNPTIQIYQTAKETGDRLTQLDNVVFEDFGQPKEYQPCVFIDTTHSFQTFIGIGSAFTDASAEVYAKLPKAKQDEFMTAYFDREKGIGYSFSRTHIASCDFSSASYDYVEENDAELKTFSIAHDKEFRIPFIKRAIEVAGNDLKMFVSPWSPPAWMKDTGKKLTGGSLLDEYRQSWANHYIKFIKAYEAEGIPIWGLSVQNEPMARTPWENCIYTDVQERDFVRDFLGPTLVKNGLSDRKLIVWDHNRDLIFQRASTMFNDKEAAKYVWGMGFHWYEPWTGGDMQFDNLIRVKEAFPEVNLVFTEGCVERFNYDRLNDWSLGERYGKSMVHDFNCGTVAWTDWNILLDEKGGPNHVGNMCFAPVHADLTKGELIYTNSYYYIGHFSKFIKPGAKRISCSSNRDVLQSTAFKNTDGSVIVVVMNAGEKDIPYRLWIEGKAVEIKSLAHSIQTLVL